MRAILSFVALGLVAGCASVGGPGVSTYMECDRGTRLKLDYVNSNTVVVSVNGADGFALPRTPSASGVSYGDAQHSLRTKGREAIWTIGRAMPETCRQVIVPR